MEQNYCSVSTDSVNLNWLLATFFIGTGKQENKRREREKLDGNMTQAGLKPRSPKSHHSDTSGTLRSNVLIAPKDVWNMIFSKLTKHDHLHAIRKWLHCGVPIGGVLYCRNTGERNTTI